MKGKEILEAAKNLFGNVQGKIFALTKVQAIAASVATVAAVGGVGAGGYLIYEHNTAPQEVVAEATEDTGLLTEDSQDDILVGEIVVESETVSVEERKISLVATSMEKDLKIKFQDQNETLVTGEKFEVSVKKDAKKAKATTYEDDDEDGIIYIESIDAGDYSVELQSAGDYAIEIGSITVTVKDKLEYKKVDVASEVKKESEVNTAVEDTAVNNVEEEAAFTDTLTLVASSGAPTKVSGSSIESRLPKATAESGGTYTVTKKVTSTGSTGNTETSGSGTAGGTDTPSTGTSGDNQTGGNDQSNSDNQTDGKDQTSGDDQTDGNDQSNGDNQSGSNTPTGASEGGAVEPETPIASMIIRRRSTLVRTEPQDSTQQTTTLGTITYPKSITVYTGTYAQGIGDSVTFKLGGDLSGWSYDYCERIEGANVAIYHSDSDPYTFTVSSVPSAGSGTAKVRIKFKYAGVSETQYIDIPVTYTNYSTINTQLTDGSGNLLYTDQNATTALTVANFKNTGTYYTAPAYLGWQTIDGKVYYFYATNQKATGDQVISGVKYTFAADGSLSQSAGNIGIDVSKYQGSIDWGAVATAGVSFAIIRVGYRGATTGALIEDPYFKTNIAGATKAGIKVGLYFFTQAVTEAEAVEEASMCIQKAAGYKVSYPIFIDTENASNGRANGLDKNTRTSIVNAFCATIQASGYKAGVYASKSWYNNNLNASSLSSYTIWVAQYNTTCTYAGRYSLWQYTSKGNIAGINGNVDMNISYLGY